MLSPGRNNSAPCSILICGPLGRRIVCNKSIEGASNETFEKTTRAPGALQSIRRDDSKRELHRHISHLDCDGSSYQQSIPSLL